MEKLQALEGWQSVFPAADALQECLNRELAAGSRHQTGPKSGNLLGKALRRAVWRELIIACIL
jgi:hypothetical protein